MQLTASRFQAVVPVVALLIAASGAAGGVGGACEPAWERAFGHPGAGAPQYFSTAVYDDGTGSALYVGSSSFHLDGTYSPSGLFKFDAVNQRWLAIADGMLMGGFAGYGLNLTVWDQDGPGPLRSVLVLAGPFIDGGPSTSVYTWDGSSLALLSSLERHLNIFDHRTAGLEAADLDNNGVDELYIFGDLQNADGGWGVAKFDPSSGTWPSLDFHWPAGQSVPESALVFDDGTGKALYISGRMDNGIDGVAGTRHVAKWNGSSWQGLGSGLPLNEVAGKLVAFDADGAGAGTPKLVALTSSNVWVWNGASWTSFAYPGLDGRRPPRAAAVVNEGGSNVLYFGGVEISSRNAELFRFDGTSVSEVGGSRVNGMLIDNVSFFSYLGTHDLGGGAQLIAAGYMIAPGTTAENFVAWNGSSWTDVGTPNVAQNRPLSIATGTVADTDGAGPTPSRLFVGGVSTALVGAWDGSSWQTINAGLPVDPMPIGGNVHVLSLASSNAGDVYAAVQDTSSIQAYRLSGAAWAPLAPASTGFDGQHVSLLVSDVGGSSSLYAFGNFRTIDGAPIAGVAYYDQETAAWAALGGVGITPTPVPSGTEYSWFRTSAQSFNDGSGDKLFVGGVFTSVGGVSSPAGVAAWSGSDWADASSGLPIIGNASAFHVPGSYRLFAAGNRLFAMSTYIADGNTLYRWTGSAWTSVGTLPASFLDTPSFLGAANTGQGDLAYFSWLFELHAFDPATFVWHDLTPSMGLISALGTPPTTALAFTVNAQPGLMLLGGFHGVGGSTVAGDPTVNGLAGLQSLPSPGVARWACPFNPCPADFNTSGSVTVQDIFDFLAAWFAGSSAADFNHVAGVTVQDIFDFLAAWFAGC